MLVTCLCLAVAGAADMISGVSRNAMLQLSASPELQGRMQGVGMAVWTTGPALGDVEASGVAALTSINTSVVLGGVACVLGIGVIADRASPSSRCFGRIREPTSRPGPPSLPSALPSE